MKFSKIIYSTPLIIAFIVALVAIKWYDTSIGLPATVMQVVYFIVPLYAVVFIPAGMHLLIFVFYTPTPPKEEWLEEKIPARKYKMFTLLAKGLFISVPVFLYGFLTWTILIAPWKMWFVWMGMYGAMRVLKLALEKMTQYKLIS